MARIQPAQVPPVGDTGNTGEGSGPGRRKAMRYAVPVAVAGVAAATISLVPALADSGNPDLPKITAEQLLTKVAASDTQTISGSVKITTDLGLPSFLGGVTGGGSLFGGAGGDDSGKGRKGSGSAADPKAQLTQLLAGSHTLHVAADGPDRQRVSIVEKAAEYSLIHNGDQVWAYDSASNQAYHSTLPKSGGKAGTDHAKQLPEDFPSTPRAAAQQALKAAGPNTSVSVDGTAKVAGRSAYQLLVQPKGGDSTVGTIRVAVDASTGVPLKFTLTPRTGGKAAIDIGFTKVDFGKPDAGTFRFTPPKGTKVTEDKAGEAALNDKADHNGTSGLEGLQGLNILGADWNSIAEIKVPKGALSGSDSGSSSERRGRNDKNVQGLIDSFGKHVTGKFGSGTVFSTRLVNALITDNGTVYVGAVNQDALLKAADAAAK
ncbi:outer membrane lipoprotein-sorting protein [Streptomyces sp. SPB162]|nr:outer membrane lipoprotein-sorting protein [Streptomyces sp. SPB162]